MKSTIWFDGDRHMATQMFAYEWRDIIKRLPRFDVFMRLFAKITNMSCCVYLETVFRLGMVSC